VSSDTRQKKPQRENVDQAAITLPEERSPLPKIHELVPHDEESEDDDQEETRIADSRNLNLSAQGRGDALFDMLVEPAATPAPPAAASRPAPPRQAVIPRRGPAAAAPALPTPAGPPALPTGPGAVSRIGPPAPLGGMSRSAPPAALGSLPRSAPPAQPGTGSRSAPPAALGSSPRSAPPSSSSSVEASVEHDADIEAALRSAPVVSSLSNSGASSRRGARPAPPPATFDREQDASAELLRTHQRDAWVERAEWLRAEVDALEDKTAQARGLLVVSELFAMSGEEARARAAADESRAIAPSMPLAYRQVRGLLARESEWGSVLEVLDAEARALPTPESRVHSALLAAEICRISLGDAEGAKKRLDLAQRVLPSDPRTYLQRFSDLLAEPEGTDIAASTAKLRLPDASELGPFAQATQQVLANRGAPSRGQRPIGSSYEALLRVRAAFAAADHAGAVAGLEGLVRSEALAGGAGWLAASLAAARGDTRARAVEALRGVLEGTHPDQARRALAARAIEIGDADAARAATEGAGPDAFTAADHVALAALSGGSLEAITPWAAELQDDPEFAPLTAAASAVLDDPGSPDRRVLPLGGPRARAAAALGRIMGAKEAPHREVSRAVLAFAEAAPETATARALSLELDLDAGIGSRVASAIAAFHDDDGDRDRTLAAAVIAEAAGDRDRAKADLERVRQMDPGNEGVARAAAAHVGPDAAARILAEHAQSLDAGSARAAVALTEAAVRLAEADDPDESEALLRRAAEIDPKLPLAHYLGERAARARDDRGALVEWLRARRESAEDPIEQAYDLVREALLLAESEPPAAASLLEQALRARPKDVGLRELYERLSPDPLADRAAWRVDRAAETTGPEAARLALEAAFELEAAGDLAGTASAAQLAVAAGDTLLAPIAAHRAALAGHGTGDLVDSLLPRARETDDRTERLEIYERLAELDERGRGDAGSALLWRRSILEDTPGHLPTLRRVASALVTAGRDEDLEPVAIEIARSLEGPEAIAHAMLSARLRLRAGTWDETREAVEIAYRNEPRGIWALRQMAAHARAQGNHALALEADRQLIERTQRASEAATLALRAAQSARKAGQPEDALAFLGHAIELVPAHLVAHIETGDALEQMENHAGAAAALESAAAASAAAEGRAADLYRAAILWQDKVGDAQRARQAFEAVVELDPSYADVFPRLQTIYIAEGARAELAALLKRRLDAVTDPAERVEMEVLRGRALADVGDAAAAKVALAAALDASPDHIDALEAFGDVSAAEGDWSGAEQAWIRLGRLVSEPERQAQIYFKLGEIYDEHLPNPERAELAYNSILERFPADPRARERLVALFQRGGDTARAIEQQTLLINAAEPPEEKCRRTTELASIYEQAGDAKKAEATLQQARKTWPKDDVALAALARFHLRNNQTQSANVLLDRAVADARRALATGRFEPYLFSTVATVAELRSRPDAARIAKAAVAALEGEPAVLDGAGAGAADPRLDDILAPDVISPAFRDLLRLTGPLLDNAVPFDLSAVRATPLEQGDLVELVAMLAANYGLTGAQAYVSSALGAVCVPVSAHPPAIVLGQSLVASPREDVRTFLIHRALKILQANAAALSRTAPIDLWPLVAAYLKAWSPGWSPQGVDAGKLNDFNGRVARALSKPADPQVGVLAADVIGSIGNRASTLNTVVNGWGNRAGLVALGDLNVAVTAIAWAGGHTNAPPPTGKERMTWIGRNAEARELIVFSVSDGYADTRVRLGLASE
jgi:cellulose synthase operon protein C